MTTKERPVLFSGAMVRAILDGRKTQTRRVVKWNLKHDEDNGCILMDPERDGRLWPYVNDDGDQNPLACPYGQPGDRLWVRETWRPFIHSARSGIYYQAGGSQEIAGQPETYRALVDLMKRTGGELIYKYGPYGDPNADEVRFDQRWRSPRYMPRWASRITLEVTGVRVERLQEITEADAYAEGVTIPDHLRFQGRECMSPDEIERRNEARATLAALWDSLNASRGFGWDTNPWVWVVEFRRINA